MNPRTEERLRAAFEAKADQVTEERLERLAAQRQRALFDDEADWPDTEAGIPLFDESAEAPTPLALDDHSTGTRHARWLAPVLAAAAVVAVAVGVTAVSQVADNGRRATTPPATRISTPSPSATPTPSPPASTAPAPSGNDSSQPATLTPPAQRVQLGRGQQAGRSQVPWSEVGPGWRLVQPDSGQGTSSTLYLYNPAGGRYLISDRLPRHAQLLAWSPDGERAMLSSPDRYYRYYQLSLRSGRLGTSAHGKDQSYFVTYTRPRGLSMLVHHTDSNFNTVLTRNALDGTLLLTYPTSLPGGGVVGYGGLYTADGTALVVGINPASKPATAPASPATASAASQGMVLLGNDGRFLRRYAAPAGYELCQPDKWWSAGSVLEVCSRADGSLAGGLFLQDIAGGRPAILAASPDSGEGYGTAWQLNNGDVLLSNGGNCGAGGYSILHRVTGAITPLKLPSGVTRPELIVSMDGDLATFDLGGAGCAVEQAAAHHRLLDYDMITGRSSILLEGSAIIVGYPG